MGQAITSYPLCCVQDSSDKAQTVNLKAQPSLHSVTLQSRNLQNESWEVRAEAADFFGRLDPENAVLVVPMLQELLLKDEAWRVRQRAANALQDLGSEAVQMAAAALQRVTKEDGHYTVRLAAAVALRKHGHKAEASLPLSQDGYTVTEPEVRANSDLDDAWMLNEPPFDNYANSSKEDTLQAKINQMVDSEVVTPRAKVQNLQHEEMATGKPVDGVPSEDTRLTSLEDISEISMVSPPREHVIVVERGESGKWGIDVDFVVHGTCLRVSRVNAGAILDWNEEHPEAMVEVGDLLVELNGVSGNSNDLVKVICKADQLEMVVQKGA